MDVLYLYIYRLCYALRGRLPSRSRGTGVRAFLGRLILPTQRLKVRVRSGLSQGLWICARFPEEASYWRGNRERVVERMIRASVHEGSVVYDVGAHVGVVTFGAARLAGGSGRVIAFDADPENVASLRKCCALNRYEERIRVVQAAVWSSNNGVAFRRGSTRRSHGGVMANGFQPVRADGEIITVESTTLDAFIASQGPRPELVKIDVEGGEYEVLRGGATLFSRDRPRIIVEVHHREALDQIRKWIEEFRYAPHWSVPPQGFPRMLCAWPAESPPITELA